MEKLYTIEEVAGMLGLHIQTVRSLVKSGDLPAHQVSKRAYRVKDTDLTRYIEERKV